MSMLYRGILSEGRGSIVGCKRSNETQNMIHKIETTLQSIYEKSQFIVLFAVPRASASFKVAQIKVFTNSSNQTIAECMIEGEQTMTRQLH